MRVIKTGKEKPKKCLSLQDYGRELSYKPTKVFVQKVHEQIYDDATHFPGMVSLL